MLLSLPFISCVAFPITCPGPVVSQTYSCCSCIGWRRYSCLVTCNVSPTDTDGTFIRVASAHRLNFGCRCDFSPVTGTFSEYCRSPVLVMLRSCIVHPAILANFLVVSILPFLSTIQGFSFHPNVGQN
ncbi:hypothetical protein PF011_g31628 [Phytophthora fragariae]|uniref:Secreted protein n=1 Tax=Phytophthora fragariae TaxID=53985 RepID=A0A6A3GPZ2_9STRA|nr:hypothetical protein PF011_g31628 [Phytophthora fragariae]